ncbi:MAG: ABC transporter permease [Bacteroidales bacterium]|nr:ABC transporter permease [Bacteroidales bacterium]
MNFPFFVARRYLFSKKSHSTINIISAISAGGIAVATMALVCVLSVFNGFRDLIGGLYSAFDPQLEVAPVKGKYADAADPLLQSVREVDGVAAVSECFEENALILYKGNPVVVNVKGVDENFARVTGVDSIIYDQANAHVKMPALSAAGVHYAIPGYGLAARMGIAFGGVQLCAPRRGERINMANPLESFNVDDIFSSDVYFQVNQKRYDESYLMTSIDFARTLFEQPNRLTSLELKLDDGADVDAVKARVEAAVGPGYAVRDRMEQHADTFKVMAIEKLMAYFFLTFIVLIACFNLIGSVSMLIIDKRDNVDTLRSLGMDDRAISRIFLIESRLISFLGAVLGIVLGLVLCYLQQTFGFLQLGSPEGGNFIINAYPVSIRWMDILLVFVTVIVVGFATVWYPVRYLCRRML